MAVRSKIQRSKATRIILMGKEKENSIRFLFEGKNPRDVRMLVCIHTYVCMYPYVSVCIRLHPIVSVKSYNTPYVQYNTYREGPNTVKRHLSLLFKHLIMVSVRQSISRKRRAASQSAYPYGRHQRGHNQLILINSRQNYLPKDQSYSRPGLRNPRRLHIW